MKLISESLSVTGFVLFLLGIITLTPEIYLSGVMVMFTSASITMKALEAQRHQETFSTESTTPNLTYGSW
jgi:flagellar biosynthesis component FlhA